jgi:hypothetical protein
MTGFRPSAHCPSDRPAAPSPIVRDQGVTIQATVAAAAMPTISRLSRPSRHLGEWARASGECLEMTAHAITRDPVTVRRTVAMDGSATVLDRHGNRPAAVTALTVWRPLGLTMKERLAIVPHRFSDRLADRHGGRCSQRHADGLDDRPADRPGG